MALLGEYTILGRSESGKPKRPTESASSPPTKASMRQRIDSDDGSPPPTLLSAKAVLRHNYLFRGLCDATLDSLFATAAPEVRDALHWLIIGKPADITV